jgi:hypothetical protein
MAGLKNKHTSQKAVMVVGFKANKLWETMLISTLLFCILPMMAFKCDMLFSHSDGYGSLWGSFIEYLCNHHQIALRNTFFIVILLHLIEAVLAGVLCAHMECEPDVALKWTFNVFIHGILSFRHLLATLFDYESQKQEPLTSEIKHALEDLAR